MKEDKASVVDRVTQIITDNQLSPDEAIRIKEVIEKKQRKINDSYSEKCLAEVIDLEMARVLAPEDIGINNVCYSVYKKCFKDTRVGKANCSALSEGVIKKFEKNIRELYGLNEKETAVFEKLLYLGLSKLKNEGLLDFVPDKEMFGDAVDLKYKSSYIKNPYSPEETDKIMQWSKRHSADVRGLAISLWFTGGISLTQIVNLTKKDCWGSVRKSRNSIMEFEDRMFYTDQKMQILRNALDQRLRDVKYVFVVPRKDGSGWKKLTELGLMRKLYYICIDLGIAYKSIHKNEAIKL